MLLQYFMFLSTLQTVHVKILMMLLVEKNSDWKKLFHIMD